MDDAALGRVLLARGVVTPERLEALRRAGALRTWALESGALSAEELAGLGETTPGGGLRRASLETRDSGIVVIPRDRTRTVTS
ncbi:MAG: hypothetical protein KIT58_23160, partial [Planctomycetota bacterium]|nr:hypothetical protein [Planctomycetota bacterium]